MLGITDLKVGTKIVFHNNPHEVISSELSKLGRGGSFMRTKLKNLRNGSIFEYTFKGNESIESADLTIQEVQYLYNDEENYYFMNLKNYDQLTLSKSQVGETAKFLKEEMPVQLLIFNDEPLTITIPIKMTFKIAYTEPGLKGDTVSSPLKTAKLETGTDVKVPLFIKSGDSIIIDTRTGSYIERAK